MAEPYTIAVILAIICLAGLFLFLSKIFKKEQRAIKTLLIMISLAACIILSQMIKVIAEANAGTDATSLALMGTTALVISITLFMFFLMYYFITYTRDLFKTLRAVKEEKRYGQGWM